MPWDSATRRLKRKTGLDKSYGDGNPLVCPVCGSVRLKVLATRSHLGTMRRRRGCVKCDFRFFTAEWVCDIDCEMVE